MTTNEFMEAVKKILETQDKLVSEVALFRITGGNTQADRSASTLKLHRDLLLEGITDFISGDEISKAKGIRSITFLLNLKF